MNTNMYIIIHCDISFCFIFTQLLCHTNVVVLNICLFIYRSLQKCLRTFTKVANLIFCLQMKQQLTLTLSQPWVMWRIFQSIIKNNFHLVYLNGKKHFSH